MAGESGRRLGDRINVLLLGVALLGMFAGGAALLYNDAVGRRNAAWITMARQIQTDALAASRIGDDVAKGQLPDFSNLAGQRDNFEDFVKVLRTGDDVAGVDPMPAQVDAQIGQVEQAWAKMKGSMGRMLDGESPVLDAERHLQTIASASQGVADVYRDGLSKLIQNGAASGTVGLAGEQLARAERLGSLSRRMLGDGRDAGAIATEIGKISDALTAGQAQLAGGDGPVAGVLKAASENVAQIAEATKGLLVAAPAVNELQVGAAVLPGDGKNLYSTAIALEEGLSGLAGGSGFVLKAIVPALGIAAIALLFYVISNVVGVRRRIRRAEEKESRQQAAILGLLDEISNLADGDLTVRANVTGEFTGAIADSINYTVETLRSLVGTINESAVEMGAAATSTTQTADAMRAASEEQARDIIDITHQVTHSSDSLGNMAGRAQDLAKSATDSVEIAHNGASTVGRTILGMAALREQIQDTAKRIKRLGESSQEIGNIIEFINDIAEQTNTLALNASIQAAMAGESGRGFAVVADEVQRLAERAAAATRQIETLVKTIQADTNEAIVSMERSTTNVIAGARSAEEAGQALTRIESSSNDLARMIQEISTETRKEAAAAANIAIQMQSVRDIALSTSNSAQDTATAVGELNTLSEKLRESVAGFKLPTDVTLETGMMPAFTEAERREAA